MRVQEILLENSKKYMLIDEKGIPIVPVVKYLKYLDSTGKSRNTQKTYCYALKQYFLYLRETEKHGFYVRTKHCTVKYLNNLIEQDHRHVKRRFVKTSGSQNICHASRTIKGIETIQALYKQRRSLESDSVFSVYDE